jgi:MoaA/NifB/PqqE/SkfB family radical SAM enzyme
LFFSNLVADKITHILYGYLYQLMVEDVRIILIKRMVNMELTGLHILLTYQCNFECDHCFVWGSPWQTGTFSLSQLEEVMNQAKDVGTVSSIYFEGGEPFLYYPILVKGVASAFNHGFDVGIVSNGYWAITKEDALEWLQPFVGKLYDLSVSSDLYHYDEELSRQAKNACQAAAELGIPIGTISIAPPDSESSDPAVGQLPLDESGVMYRGRAAEKLARKAQLIPWTEFTECPYEDLREPGRVHLDPLGNLHICQGISIGNLFERPLKEICETYIPDRHPITGPLLTGGPAELVRAYDLPLKNEFADACHLCYTARISLRDRFAKLLGPDQVYGAYAA